MYFLYPIPAVATIDGSGLATEAKQDAIISALGSGLTLVDEIDTTPVLDTSVTNIPASSGNPVQVIASLAGDVQKIYPIDDIGEYIGLYTGAALSETLACILPLGGGPTIEITITSGTRISLRAMENTAITSGKIALNFIG
jgi:hypothetical protein